MTIWHREVDTSDNLLISIWIVQAQDKTLFEFEIT